MQAVRLKYKKWQNGAKSGETEQKVTKQKQKVAKQKQKSDETEQKVAKRTLLFGNMNKK